MSIFRMITGYAAGSAVNHLFSSFSSSPVQDIPATLSGYTEEQRIFGEPGISLRYAGDELTEDAINAGITGETRVAEQLHALAAQYPNTYVFHSMKLPGQLGDMDHIVVQGNRVLLVDAKNWKGKMQYDLVASTPEEATILRNGEEFVGGDIHLERQMHDWSSLLVQMGVSVMNAVLVIANHTSTPTSQVGVPFMFTNLNNLQVAFEQTFVPAEEVYPLDPNTLHFYLDMVQGFDYSTMLPPVYVPQPVAVVKPPVPGFSIGLMVWSILNYLTIPLLFPVAGLSALVVIILTHIQLHKTTKRGLGGKVLLVLTLVFSYLLTAVWLMAMALVVVSQVQMF